MSPFLAPRQQRPACRNIVIGGAALGLIGAVAGCSMFQSNVRGGFICSAPNGSCAPTSIIDDGAIRGIRQSEKTDKGGDLLLPSASSTPGAPDAIIYPAEHASRAGKVATSIGGRALKVIYPAHLGADGKVVPKRIAYALVDLPDWQDVETTDGRVTDPVSRGLLGAAQNAPDALIMSSAAAGNPTGSSLPPVAHEVHGADVQSAAASTAPIDAIKAQADQILRAAKVKSAGTFPPEAN